MVQIEYASETKFTDGARTSFTDEHLTKIPGGKGSHF